MIERTINKVLKSISNLPAEYKIALIRILTGIVENIITLDKGKVDKEQGKNLSTNDFTDELKNKLNNIENGAQKNVKSDWNAITGDSIILNKPSLNEYPDSAIWDEQNKNIIFKHQGTILPQMTISGANFIKDGMVDNVQIQDNNLVITFNTDAGKSPFSIPLINIFNPNNYYNKTQTDNKFVEKVTGKQLSTEDFTTDLKTKLENIGDANLITSITYNELKTLRDNNQLSLGMQYRITDYQCTTIQTNTQSANHQFDIIVIADDVNKLNENAKACLHNGDTYFANSKLESWELKYRLDNDTTEFEWADATNGKGIIYWMKDEWGNECPYDFKNIQYKYNNKWMYTFNDTTDSNNIVDGSIQGYTNNITNNKIKSRYNNNKYGIATNIFNIGCHHNTLKNNCYNNIFGNGCMYNVLEINCYNNIFGNSCNNNILKIGCNSNVFDNNSGSNILYSLCSSNKFGYWCQYNILYSYCSDNTFSNYCDYNILYTGCMSNNFSTHCCYNIFENHCRYIYMGKSYMEHIIVESGNMNMTITSTQTTSSVNILRNFKIAQGVNNTGITKTISHDTVNDAFQTIYKHVNSVETQV